MEAIVTDKETMFAALPEEWPEALLPEIKAYLRDQRCKLVVLDDDPTGTQTVHGIPVLTTWTIDALTAELYSQAPAFYILTNSRSMPLAVAQQLNQEIGARLKEASEQTGVPFTIISRSDSTLRGHFPGETDALLEALQLAVDAVLLIPFFLEGGRFTLNDIHWVADDTQLIPAGQTQFARDAAFGYQHSNLKNWVEEKTQGQHPSDDVFTISLEDIRQGGPKRIKEILMGLNNKTICVVNSASYRDMEVFVLGLLQAEADGKQFLYRTAASFARTRAGLGEHPLLTRRDLVTQETTGGLIVVGSYVNKTSTQLGHLLQNANVEAVELDVQALLSAQAHSAVTRGLAQQVSMLLQDRRDVVLHTSRKLITGQDAESSLAIGNQVSDALVDIIRNIAVTPRYILAKGGITSSDVATRGLNIFRAMVLGQILPGVPVWQAGEESRYPNIPYIVFPGNVGTESSITDIVRELAAQDA